jgi:hypothetical protein
MEHFAKKMDCRVKPGNDGENFAALSFCSYSGA